ncbi:HSF5 protein, partial [Oxylabes madagascariensis]|nr:HSF5 protein [Oxylabes madagascariensis]
PAGLNASALPAKLWHLVNSPCVRSVRWDSQAQGLLINHSLFKRELLSSGSAHRVASDSFKVTQFNSFLCQLNLYGFHEVPGWVGMAVPGNARGWVHFKNPNCRRNRPDLLLCFKRLTRANQQWLVAGLEVCSHQPSCFQQ